MKHFLIIVLLMGYSSLLFGQQDGGEANCELLYQQARESVFAGRYGAAHNLLRQVLTQSPQHHDAALLEARLFLWQKDYDASAKAFEAVKSAFPESNDVKELGYDLVFFSGQFARVVDMAPDMIAAFPDRIDFREKYAQALWALERREETGRVADEILAIDPTNEVALEIKRLLAEPMHPLKLHLNYSFDHFDEPYLRWWHLYSAGLSKKYDGYSLGATVNVGHLNDGDTEFQVEGESYVTLTQQSYMYVMYGYSSGSYFPEHKASLEVWHQLPAEMVASLGMNYYHWNNNIFIATASVEKYLRQFWFCFRGYGQFKDSGLRTSWYFTARRYFNATDYLQVTLGVGTAPDEPYDIKTDLERLSAYSIRALGMKQLSHRTALRVGLGVAREEYAPDVYRARFDGTVGIIYLLSK
ncbi:YaiO family outer membrane protein [Breznakibacter xylanolyticus]|uniref:YaiO family outer membrane protein n=1 Tax=Breznakibacter xylanolyticus TaxID=990 RepID=A0A2W7P4H7_9BACT|nr:YaiO family outer membrane beta-barrel protein [Breznakibacter xylanolyticus]PZX20256.1 YaiO family outer membrane protein [Breznakibacter xylanolyticus]